MKIITKSSPIGMFDSGVGGTSIFKAVQQLLPNEQVIYLADSKNAPYGAKSKSEIRDLSFKNTQFLLDRGAKIIVVACNTATTNAIIELRSTFKVPIIGIEPAIKPAALQSTTKVIGILATQGTLTSELFTKTSELFTKDIEVIEVIGKGLVPLIEKGKLGSQQTRDLLVRLLQPMLVKGIDYLVLGCSHYPYLIPLIKEILPSPVRIIDSGEAVAKQTKTVLQTAKLLYNGPKKASIFYSNQNPNVLNYLVNKDQREKLEVSYLDF
ncbi:glutamate racemase [Mesonia sp. MT50]|uniref:Glutamate racemase n=1 Tax=Mesonia profundi TaxID=3070998 RepID=A0ABU0ZZZ7_9FLAO|nr:glutamate racemase [Mesonia profundi]MDQ7917028.1 glutamate racemase [Mesonia profundi]